MLSSLLDKYLEVEFLGMIKILRTCQTVLLSGITILYSYNQIASVNISL